MYFPLDVCIWLVKFNWWCRYDCGMFAIKYMQYWNGATLAHSITEVSTTNTLLFGFVEVIPYQAMIFVCVVQDKMHLYKLRLVMNLLTNDANNAGEKVMQAYPMWGMRVVPFLLVAIYNKLKLAYKRQNKREWKKMCIYIITFSLIKHSKAWSDLSLMLLDNWQQIFHLVNKMKLLQWFLWENEY